MKNLFLGIVVLIILVLGFYYFSGNTLPGMNPDTGTGASISSSMQSSIAPTAAGREISCTDGADNDGDELADCDDSDCGGNAVCRCSALSCGEGGTDFSCLPAAGCICDDAVGCTVCKSEGQACDNSADCCQGLGYECTAVTRGTGGTEKRCMRPTNTILCEISCTDDGSGLTGTWGRAENCGAREVPPDTEDCATLVGTCDLSAMGDRNVRNCWKS